MKFIIRTGKPWAWLDSIRRNRLVIGFMEPRLGGLYIGEEQQHVESLIPLSDDTPWEHHQLWFHLWLSSKLYEGHPKKDKLCWYSEDEWDGEELRSLKLLRLRANWNSETFCAKTWTNIFLNKEWPLNPRMKTQRVIQSLYRKVNHLFNVNEAQGTVLSVCFLFMRETYHGTNTPRILLAVAELGDVFVGK